MEEKIRTAILLVGGDGTRLGKYTENRPKPLVEVYGKPILSWIFDWLKSEGIGKIVFCVGNKKEPIEKFVKQNSNFGFDTYFSENSLEGGTAEAFKNAIENYIEDENFLAMNGDELTNLDLSYMAKRHFEHNPTVTMALAPFYCPFSVVEFGSDSKVTRFKYGRYLHDLPISIGIYLFNSRIKNRIPEKGSIEDIVFTELAYEGEILAHNLKYGEEWITINNPKDIKRAENKLRSWSKV